MGQAKQRGTYEQRKVAGESKRVVEIQRRRAHFAAKDSLMTPEQRLWHTKISALIATLIKE